MTGITLIAELVARSNDRELVPHGLQADWTAVIVKLFNSIMTHLVRVCSLIS